MSHTPTRITQLDAHNLKGRFLSLNFDPVSILCGDNFVGKSGIVDALIVGLTDTHPIYGKQPFAIFENMSGGDEMIITPTAGGNDEFIKWSLTWRQKKTGGVQHDGEVPSRFLSPSILFSAEEYFKRTDQERVDYVFSQVELKPDEYSDDELMTRARKVEALPAAVSARLIPGFIADLEKEIAKRKASNTAIQTFLSLRLQALKDKVKEANAQAKQAAGSVIALKQQIGTPVPADHTADIEACRQTINGLKEKLGRNQAQCEAVARDRARLLKRQAEITAVLRDCGYPTREALSAASVKHQAQEKTLADYKSNLPALEAKVTAQEAKITELQATTAAQDAKLNLIDTMEHVSGDSPVCLHCGNDAPGWQEKSAAFLAAQREQIAQKKQQIEPWLTSYKAELLKLKMEVAKASDADDQHENSLLVWQEQKAELVEAEKLLTELAGIVIPEVDNTSAALLAEEQTVLAKIKLLEVQQAERNAALELRKRATQAEDTHVAKVCEAELLKGLVEVVSVYQREIIGAAFNRLLAHAAKFTTGILNSDLEFHDNGIGRRATEADRDKGFRGDVGRWIPHKSLSGTERLLAYAALSVALCQSSPIKLVIMDELGRLTPKRRVELVARMNELIAAGVIDQFVGVDVEPAIYKDVPGVTVITV